MVTIIAGTRTIDNYIVVVNAIIASDWWHEISEVVCGDCQGVDSMGEIWANSRGLPVKHFPVTREEWQKHGKAAGPMRNLRMAEYAAPDGALILVWDGASRGSKSMLRCARQCGLKFYQEVVTP